MTDRGFQLVVTLGLLAGLAGSVAQAENIDPGNDDSQYAYAENVGWLNAEPNGDGGNGIHVESFTLAGYLWGENVGWVSLSCTNSGSCGRTDYGVTNDGHGTLSGYAWAENVGWLSFSCENTSSCGTTSYGVAIDPSSGEFSGRAWAENIGWVTFASAGANPYKVETGWCRTTAAAPSGTPTVSILASGEMSWLALGDADWYETVRGDLATLRSSGGDFSAAREQCAIDNLTETTTALSGTPSAGETIWYLVRGVNCKGKGTYDSGGSDQVNGRDAEISASGNDCP